MGSGCNWKTFANTTFVTCFRVEGQLVMLLVLCYFCSFQPMTGHCLGGTAGIETVVAAKVLQTGDVPATLNYSTPDPECDLNYVPNKAVHLDEPLKVSSL